MDKLIEIKWTAGSIDEARRVSRILVKERIVAGAKIIPWIETIEMLDNQLETSQESLVFLKSIKENFSKIKELIEKNSSYEIPEITYIEIEGFSQKYLEWVRESLVAP